MNSPTVSVVMSVFNGQVFLAEAIESILNQTFEGFEFLIIDDGSTDGTSEILAKYASKDERIRVYRHENKGRAESLNIGISLAKGSYIARMDADDIALPRRLKEQVEFMDMHPEVGLLGGAFEMISTTGEVLQTMRFPSEDAEIRSMMLVRNPISHPTVLMRKDVALASGGYRKALVDADDYDLWLRMSERSKLANLENCVLRYRLHPNQVSIQNMNHQMLCVLAARAAASWRRSGGPDPLRDIEKVTPQLLARLGIAAVEIRQSFLGVYRYWINTLGPSDPEATLRVIEEFLRLSGSEYAERSAVADAGLKAAGIHYRQGRWARALVSAGRAFLARPIIMGRPVKRAFMRFTGALKS